MATTNITRFERFFRVAASLDIDKQDLKRYDDFVEHKVEDMLVRARATAKANDRDVMQTFDVPVTKGLQESMHEFRRLKREVGLEPVLDQLTPRPYVDVGYSDDLYAMLPEIVGGMSVALGRTFKIIDPELKNPQTRHWEVAFRIFDQLL
jgi:hypothetical protein